MGLFKNIPTAKKTQVVGDKIIYLSQELRNLIVSYHCVDFSKVNLSSLEYVLFMYDLECYRQVMTLKHNHFYIEATIRTIFTTMERNQKKAGYNINDGYMFNIFKNTSDSLNQVYRVARQQGLDGLYGVALHLCSNECELSTEEIENNKEMVNEIAEHFNKIINLPTREIP